MKLIEKIKEFISEKIEIVNINSVKLEDEQIERVVKNTLDLIKYEYLPHGACWLCSHPVSRSGGYETWRGRMFCSRQCTRKYAQLVSKPDTNYEYLQGDPVEVIGTR